MLHGYLVQLSSGMAQNSAVSDEATWFLASECPTSSNMAAAVFNVPCLHVMLAMEWEETL